MARVDRANDIATASRIARVAMSADPGVPPKSGVTVSVAGGVGRAVEPVGGAVGVGVGVAPATSLLSISAEQMTRAPPPLAEPAQAGC